MKIGILCEGEFTDKPVLEVLLKDRFPAVDFCIRGVSKSVIFANADFELASMFNHSKVERFLILWDLLPIGDRLGVSSQWSKKPDRREQRYKLLELLCKSQQLPEQLVSQCHGLARRYGFPFGQTNAFLPAGQEDLLTLVCVCYELEGWFLSDHKILCNLASTASHQVDRLDPNPGDPDDCNNPSAYLKRFFGTRPNKYYRLYAKHSHNQRIAREYVEQGKVGAILQSSQSFQRVVKSIKKWVHE
jgi:hypothetical protein